MEGVDQENSFSVGMAQLDGNRNRGVVVQKGEILILALMTWEEKRKTRSLCGNGIEWHYIANIMGELLFSESKRCLVCLRLRRNLLLGPVFLFSIIRIRYI